MDCENAIIIIRHSMLMVTLQTPFADYHLIVTIPPL